MTTARNLKDLQVGPSIPKKARSLFIAAIVSLVAMGLAQQLMLVETELVNQITPALADYGFKSLLVKSGVVSTVIEFVVLLITATVAAQFGLRLKKSPNLIPATVIIFLGSCFLQIALFAATGTMPLFASTLIETIVASAAGRFWEENIQRQKAIESQYYELLMRKTELDEARLALVKQNEVERRILAADLHDQVLNDLKKILETFSEFEKDPSNRAAGGSIRSGFQKTMNDIREIMDDLCPIMLQNFGLRAAVEDCLDKGKERSGYDTRFDCTIDDDYLEKISEVDQALLFRLVQESLTNISKHANAKNVSILIERNKGNLNISIEDDGKGMDYKNVSHQSRGLRYMKMRAELIDAIVEWRPGRDGKGTKVVIIFPLPA